MGMGPNIFKKKTTPAHRSITAQLQLHLKLHQSEVLPKTSPKVSPKFSFRGFSDCFMKDREAWWATFH